MTHDLPFAIVFARAVKGHLLAIEAKHHSLIRSTIHQQLSLEPTEETRNRKPLSRPASFGADWEIRFGPDNRFRVFYSVDDQRREVLVIAIGVKRKDRLSIGGVEVIL